MLASRSAYRSSTSATKRSGRWSPNITSACSARIFPRAWWARPKPLANETPLDRFKAVLAGTARAISEEPEVELAFTADAPTQ
ncbi:hypothetical protein AB2C85_32435, partial [Pseudomonas aeruginosa]